MTEQRRLSKRSMELDFFLPVFLFALALLPRLLTLDAFLTPDEYHWVRRSRHFLAGVLRQDWASTLQEGHPGVTTMWTGTLGILYRYWTRPPSAPDDLLAFVERIPSDPIDIAYIIPTRFPTAILSAVTVVAFFWLTARLFDRRTALIAACLFALNPFHIAHSRVFHHDALVTTFMTLSLLPLIGYWLHGWGRPWLIASGVMGGLAFLSKSTAVLLIPFWAIAGVWTCILGWRGGERAGWRAVGRLILDGTLWGATASITYGLVWPVMWREPVSTLSTVLNFVSGHVYQPHVWGHYFFGEYTPDPGLLFYPLTWLLRTTPLNLLGLGVLVALAAGRKRLCTDTGRKEAMTTYLCVAYLLFFAGMLTLGAKKQDRYILPVFPVLDLLAALGLVRLWQILSSRWPKTGYIAQTDLSHWLVVGGVVIVQAAFALPHHPYYLTYYNPLLGGVRGADRLVTVGWGEGLDQAAAYLNQKPDADNLEVDVWCHSAFEPFFKGRTVHDFYAGDQMSADYLVIYRNQIQRQMPDPHLLAYLQRHCTPEYVANLKGFDYALVYSVPLDYRTNWQQSQVPDKLILYGYRQVDGLPGVLTIRLVWKSQGMSAEDGLWAALGPFESHARPSVGGDMAWKPCRLAPGFSLAEYQELGSLVESECELNTADLEPGIYSLYIGVGPYSDQQAVDTSPSEHEVMDLLAPLGNWGVSVSSVGEPSLVARQEILDAETGEELPPSALPLHFSFGHTVELIGYQVLSPSLQPNHTTTVRLYWRALQDSPQPASLAQDFQIQFGFVTPDGGLIAGASDKLLGSVEVGKVWQFGDVLVDSYQVPLPDSLPSRDCCLAISLIRADTGEFLPVLDEATGVLTTNHVQLEKSLVIQ